MYNEYMDINQYSIVGSHFSELSAALLTIDRDEIERAIFDLRSLRSTANTAWIVGNGGSAATASHFANDLVKIAGVKAIAVPDQVPSVSAYGNDEGWDHMYARFIRTMSNPGDMVVAISCSGNSPNVVEAAKELNYIIVLTGNDPNCDLSRIHSTSAFIMINSDDITVQEDAHLAVCHAIAKALK